jgi:hypothetical protein
MAAGRSGGKSGANGALQFTRRKGNFAEPRGEHHLHFAGIGWSFRNAAQGFGSGARL